MAERLSTGGANALLADFAETFKNGVIAIYTGSQPASADAAETGTMLCLITNNGGAFTAGEATNGLNFGAPADGKMDKANGETWKGVAVADGAAGWFRFYDNSYTTGASTTAKRWDGTISTEDADEMQMAGNTQIVTGHEVTIEEFPVSYQLPG